MQQGTPSSPGRGGYRRALACTFALSVLGPMFGAAQPPSGLAARPGEPPPVERPIAELDIGAYGGIYEYRGCNGPTHQVRYGGFGTDLRARLGPDGAVPVRFAVAGGIHVDEVNALGEEPARSWESASAGALVQVGYDWAHFGFRVGGALLFMPEAAGAFLAALPSVALRLGPTDGLSLHVAFADDVPIERGFVSAALVYRVPREVAIGARGRMLLVGITTEATIEGHVGDVRLGGSLGVHLGETIEPMGSLFVGFDFHE